MMLSVSSCYSVVPGRGRQASDGLSERLRTVGLIARRHGLGGVLHQGFERGVPLWIEYGAAGDDFIKGIFFA